MTDRRVARARAAHRGSGGDMAVFAPQFISDRFIGFDKDMAICLAGTQLSGRQEPAHAYFPALMACCGMFEYLAGLNAGNLKHVGLPHLRE